MATTINRNSKADTVLFLDLPAADPWTDYSQYRTDLADQTTYIDESPSARCALGGTRSVAVVVDMVSGQDGVLAELSESTTVRSWRVALNSAGNIQCYESGGVRVFAAVPGLAVGARKILVHWAIRPEGTSTRSELAIYNFATSEWSFAATTHVNGTVNAAHTLTVGAAFGGGALLFDGGLSAFHTVRISSRFHSTTEAAEDWVSETTAPTMSQVRRDAPLVLDRATLPVAIDGALMGPAHLLAGYAFEHSDRRLVGPLVNCRVGVPLEVTHDYDIPNSAWWRTAPGDADLHLCVALLWYRVVPGKTNRAHVRLFVRQTCSVDTVTAQVTYRAYSIAGLPALDRPAEPLKYHRTSASTCSVDHGATAGVGEWLDLGALPLAVDSWGCTWVAVAVAFDEESGLVDDTSAFVHAITIEPYQEPVADGLDILDP